MLVVSEQGEVYPYQAVAQGCPEGEGAEAEDGVFYQPSSAAYLQGEAGTADGQERYPASGAHIQQTVRERTEGEASEEGVRQRAEIASLSEYPQQEPPAEPVRPFAMHLVVFALAVEQRERGALLVDDVGHDGA